MIPAVIYARYSSSNQREESIAGQLRDCHAFAHRNGYRVVKEYTDSAMTATSDRRPSFQRMIADAKKRTFEVVIVWKLDRFARDRYDAAIYRKKLKDNGVRLVSAMENITDSPEGIILEGMLEAMAEYYSANLSENVKRGTYDSALQRKVLGTMPLGYRKGEDGKYEIDPDTAPIVQRIFREYLAGRPRAEITAGLNADGFHTSKGTPFSKNAIYAILRNEKYTGMYRFKDIADPEGIPPIIDRETYEMAQKSLKTKSFTKKRADLRADAYHLAGKVFCGLCGRPMTGESARSKTGKVFKYYSCVGRKSHECTKSRIRKDWLEEHVIRVVNDQILTDEMIERFVEEYRKNMKNISDQEDYAAIYRNELQDVERKIQNTSRAIAEGAWSPTVSKMLEELENRRSELEYLIREEEAKEPPITPEMVREYFLQLRQRAKAEDECQQTLVDVFVRKIYVFEPQKKGDPVKVVLEMSLTGSAGIPESYETMLELSSSVWNNVRAAVIVSNSSIFVCCTL